MTSGTQGAEYGPGTEGDNSDGKPAEHDGQDEVAVVVEEVEVVEEKTGEDYGGDSGVIDGVVMVLQVEDEEETEAGGEADEVERHTGQHHSLAGQQHAGLQG